MARRLLLVIVLLALPASALGWTSIITDTGNALSWDSGNPETTWHLSSNYVCTDLSASTIDTALGNGMNEWSMPGCTSFNALQGSDRSGNPTDQNQNQDLVGWTTAWPSAWGSTALAVTVPVFYNSGEILEVSLTFNAQNYSWTNGNPTSWDQADVESIAVHEFGHWLGFDHSTFTGSSLNAYYSGGTVERTLTCDDSEGVCSKYSSSGNSCTDDRYCECGVGCNGGTCGGSPTDDDDTVADDDDAVMGECAGGDEGMSESEPNDWEGDEDIDYDTPGGGDFTISGVVSTCGNNGESYTGDLDWFVVDFPCQDDARFVLDWNGNDSDLDFYVWVSTGENLTGAWNAGMDGPEVVEEYAGGRLFFLVACWEGDSTSYEFKVDWAPWDALQDDDDAGDDDVGDDDAGDDDAGDDDAGDDDAGDDDDDDDDDDDGGGTSRPVRRGCMLYAGEAASTVGLLGLVLLGVVGVTRKRRG